MAIQENPYPLRINKDLMTKVKYIAKDNGRSVNKEIEMVLKRYVADFEQQNGTITINED